MGENMEILSHHIEDSPHSRLHYGDPQLQQISKCIFQYEHSKDGQIHPGSNCFGKL